MRTLKKEKRKSKYLECEHRDRFFLCCQVWPIRDSGTGWSLFEVEILYGRSRTVSRAGPRLLTLETHVTPSTWLHQSKAILSKSIAPLFRTNIILLKTVYSAAPCTGWKGRCKGLSLTPIWAHKYVWSAVSFNLILSGIWQPTSCTLECRVFEWRHPLPNCMKSFVFDHSGCRIIHYICT